MNSDYYLLNCGSSRVILLLSLYASVSHRPLQHIIGRYHTSAPIDKLSWLTGVLREDYQNCSVLYCVPQLYSVICTLM